MIPYSTLKSQWPKTITCYAIPRQIVHRTQTYLKKLGKQKLEGIAYWTGKFSDSKAIIMNVIFPDEYRGSPKKSWRYSHVDLNTALRVGKTLHERKEFLLVQLHTHPFEAFHSWLDDNYPISHRVGFISIVIPYFARLSLDDLSTWKVYEYKGTGRWRELSQDNIKWRFLLIEE